jgi:hypothetical protein
VRAAIVGSMVVAAISIALLPLLWVAIGLVILAARWSRSASSAGAPGSRRGGAPEAG